MFKANRDEIRRLQKAARDNDKRKLAEWMEQFYAQIYEKLRKEFEKAYHDEVQDGIDNLLLALSYTLYFSEETTIKKENIAEFMSDYLITVDMFRTGEYKPEDYLQQLKEVGIEPAKCDYSHLYKEKQEKLDKLINEYTQKLESFNKDD